MIKTKFGSIVSHKFNNQYICYDSSIQPILKDRILASLDSDEFRLYPFDSVPRPNWDGSVGEVEWSADLTTALQLGDDDRTEVIQTISNISDQKH